MFKYLTFKIYNASECFYLKNKQMFSFLVLCSHILITNATKYKQNISTKFYIFINGKLLVQLQ